MGTDMLVELVPAGPSLIPTQLPHPFTARINAGLSSNVRIMRKAAATVDSTADNAPVHAATPPNSFATPPPQNQSTIVSGSTTVRINRKAAARAGDDARTGNESSPTPAVVAAGTVRIG